MSLSGPLKAIFGLSAASLAIVAGLTGALGVERASEELTSGTQTCTITESYMGTGVGRLKTGQQFARGINFIKTAECGTLRNDTLYIPLGIPLAPQAEIYCKLQPGDTWQLRTFRRMLAKDKFIAAAIKLEKTTPSLQELPHAAAKRAETCFKMSF